MSRKKIKFDESIELHQSPLKNLGIDLDGDRRKDFIIQEYTKKNSDSNRILFYRQDASGGVQKSKLFRTSDRPTDATIKSADLNGDGMNDVLIFDYGYKFNGYHSFTGIEPILLLGRKGQTPARSRQLTQAYREHYEAHPGWYDWFDRDINNKVAAKDFTFGDIDSDGDLDIWVESSGGVNLNNHFLINDGETFTVDLDRVPKEFNTGPKEVDYYRYHRSMLSDVNKDGFDDLVLGQLRDGDARKASQSSFILINNGKGFFDQKIRLPRPKFNRGYTMARSISTGDFNGDELEDVVIAHTRIGSPVPGMNFNPVTGNFLQLLIQRDDGSFLDFSRKFLGKQKKWSTNKKKNINLVDNIDVRDIDRDGWNDLIINYRSSNLDATRNPTIFVNHKAKYFQPAFLSDGAAGSKNSNYFWDSDNLQGSGPFEAWRRDDDHILIVKEVGIAWHD